ncbi:MAG: hypothetical protein ACRERU_08095 [Methylococcales bacterium]
MNVVDGFSDDGDLSRALLVRSPRNAVALSFLNQHNISIGNRGGEAFGIPVVTTQAIDNSTVVLIDPGRILVAYGGVVPDIAGQISLQTGTDSCGDPVLISL